MTHLSSRAEQLTLALSRRTDPTTSHDAADRALAFRVRHEELILDALGFAGDVGATAKDIARHTGLTDVQVCRRLGSMGERKLVYRVETSPHKFIARNGSAVWWRS